MSFISLMSPETTQMLLPKVMPVYEDYFQTN